MEESILLVAPRPSAAGIELSARFDPDVPRRVLGDPLRLRQILFNLLANAVQFTDAGSIRVRAAVEDEGDDRVVVRLSIQDSGAGVAPSVRPHVFDAFSTTSGLDGRGGVGLGLAIVRSLAEQMGGEVGVEEPPGGGSRFWFTAALGRLDSGPWHRPLRPRLEDRSVLVLGPDPDNRATLEAELTAAGARVRAVEGWTQAPPDRPDLIVQAWRPGVALALPDDLVAAWAGVPRILTVPLGTPAEDLPHRPDVVGTLTRPLRPTRMLDCLEALFDGPAAGAADLSFPPDGGASVLVVDDNDVHRRVVRAVLERVGHTVATACDGAEAVAAVAEGAFDLVLMDCRMPGVDGFEATRRIRATEHERRVPIVAVTGDAVRGDHARFESAGMDDVVAKPVAPAQLRELVDRWAGED